MLFANERLAALTLPVGAITRIVPVPSAASAPESKSAPFTVSVWLPARYTPPTTVQVLPPAIVTLLPELTLSRPLLAVVPMDVPIATVLLARLRDPVKPSMSLMIIFSAVPPEPLVLKVPSPEMPLNVAVEPPDPLFQSSAGAVPESINSTVGLNVALYAR